MAKKNTPILKHSVCQNTMMQKTASENAAYVRRICKRSVYVLGSFPYDSCERHRKIRTSVKIRSQIRGR